MNLTDKLITLADNIDALGLTKHAKLLDQIVVKIARNEDFNDLMKLFDQPVKLEHDDEEIPGQRSMSLPEDDGEMKDDSDMRPEEEARLNRRMEGAGDYLPEDYTHPKYRRLDELKRRHELMKLKKMLDKMEDSPEEKVEEAPYIEPEEERKQRLRALDEAGLRNDWSQDAVAPSGSIPESVDEDEVLSDEQSAKLEQLEMNQNFEDENSADDKSDLKYRLLLNELRLNRNARRDLEDNDENDVGNPEWQELKNDQYKLMLGLDKIDSLWRDKEDYWNWDKKDEEYYDKMNAEAEANANAREAKRKELGLVECWCGDDVRPGQKHYSGGDPENGPAHTPESSPPPADLMPEEENLADDGLIDALKDAADKAPEALKKVLQLVKDNPELMTLALELL